MKGLLFGFVASAAGLVCFERFVVYAEIFTESVRVSPESVTLKPGEYVWETERAPEGPMPIVASITEQVAYVYRNGIRIARSDYELVPQPMMIWFAQNPDDCASSMSVSREHRYAARPIYCC